MIRPLFVTAKYEFVAINERRKDGLLQNSQIVKNPEDMA